MNRLTWGKNWSAWSLGWLVAALGSGCTSGLPYQYHGQPGMGYPPPGTHQALRPNTPYSNPPGAAPNGIQPVNYQQPAPGALPPPHTTTAGLAAAMPQPATPAAGGLRPVPLGPTLAAGPTVGPMPMPGQPMPGMSMPGATAVVTGNGLPGMPAEVPPLPRELTKSVMPPYTLEAPDTIYIDVLKAIPKPPYKVEPLDVLAINVGETLPNQPIGGTFMVSPDGIVNLGFGYGVVRVAGLTLEQAAMAIKLVLKAKLTEPQVGVGLAQFRGTATLRGDFMLAQDGTITLGSYGCVQLAGLTLAQAKAMIERHLSQWLMNPEVSVTVTGYNSKVYYVIADGAGFGMGVWRFPITGNETVLDAMAQISGLPAISSKKRIWLARPSPACKGGYQILPIHWEVLVMGGDTATNWQLFPGDRIYIGADPWIECNNTMAKVMAPIERALGITLLGASTFQIIRNNNNNNNGNNNGNFGGF